MNRIRAVLVTTSVATALAACGYREPVPPDRATDARFGRFNGAGEMPPRSAMCRQWSSTVVDLDGHLARHNSFPETNVRAACFTEVIHDGRNVHVGAMPEGCGYPNAPARERLRTLASELDALAKSGAPSALIPCSLTTEQRRAAYRQNADVLRTLAGVERDYPYAAVVLPGHGIIEQDQIVLKGILPERGCGPIPEVDVPRFGNMIARSALGADAIRGEAAPVVIASGGAIHSHLVEAFAFMHLLVCREHIPANRILLEPCADHTHTNLRNSGRWMTAMGARTAYLLTDDGIQGKYFQDWTGFEVLGGSVDQRSLRDWGYVIGAWRQASIGIEQGFWFTPYRFWAEPKDGLGSVTCVDP